MNHTNFAINPPKGLIEGCELKTKSRNGFQVIAIAKCTRESNPKN